MPHSNTYRNLHFTVTDGSLHFTGQTTGAKRHKSTLGAERTPSDSRMPLRLHRPSRGVWYFVNTMTVWRRYPGESRETHMSSVRTGEPENPPSLGDVDDEVLLEAYRSGLSMAQIGLQYNVSRQRVHQRLTGLEGFCARPHTSAHASRRCVVCGRSVRATRKTCSARCLAELLRSKRTKTKRNRRAFAMYLDGIPLAEIGKFAKVRTSGVYTMLQRHADRTGQVLPRRSVPLLGRNIPLDEGDEETSGMEDDDPDTLEVEGAALKAKSLIPAKQMPQHSSQRTRRYAADTEKKRSRRNVPIDDRQQEVPE